MRQLGRSCLLEMNEYTTILLPSLCEVQLFSRHYYLQAL